MCQVFIVYTLYNYSPQRSQWKT